MPHPPPPHHFSNGPSLNAVHSKFIDIYFRVVTTLSLSYFLLGVIWHSRTHVYMEMHSCIEFKELRFAQCCSSYFFFLHFLFTIFFDAKTLTDFSNSIIYCTAILCIKEAVGQEPLLTCLKFGE